MDRGRLQRLLSSLHGTDPRAPVLSRICIVCVEATNLDGAGISQMVHGRLETVAASDGSAAEIEGLQVRFAEGPCVDVVRSFRPAFQEDLRSDVARARWPQFSVAASELGIAAAFAFPLLTHGVAIGALDVYAAAPGALASAQVADVQVLADLATLAIDHDHPRPSIPGVDASSEAAEPWAYPAVVHQASGVVSEQLGIDVDEALLRLRAVAFARATTVLQIAGLVVERELHIERWGRDE